MQNVLITVSPFIFAKDVHCEMMCMVFRRSEAVPLLVIEATAPTFSLNNPFTRSKAGE